MRVRFLVDRESYERLECADLFAWFRNPLDPATPVPDDPNDRMNRNMDGQSLAVDRSEHRVDEKRHIVVDHLDEGERGLVAVGCHRRVEKPNQGLAFLPRCTEFQMIQRHARHDLLDPALQVFVGYVGKVLAKIAFYLLPAFEDVGLHPRSHDGVDNSFPDVASPAIFGSCHS